MRKWVNALADHIELIACGFQVFKTRGSIMDAVQQKMLKS